MLDAIKILAVIVFVAFVAVLLAWLLPALLLLELFLILGGILLLVGGSLAIFEEIGYARDLRHLQRIRRKLREIDLCRAKRGQSPLEMRVKRTTREKELYE